MESMVLNVGDSMGRDQCFLGAHSNVEEYYEVVRSVKGARVYSRKGRVFIKVFP